MAIVYTETVVHADPPYQIAIITLDDGTRRTVRIVGERVVIDQRVELLEIRDGVSYYQAWKT